jgi:glycosyltransferase involved in cell wall biosynthesis
MMHEELRVNIQQPALPSYRVPFFRRLAKVPGFCTTLYYGAVSALPQATADGFASEHVTLHSYDFLGHSVLWHTPQVSLAQRHRSDVLLLSWDLHYASLIPGLLRARASGVPTILWGHGISKREAPARRVPRELVAQLATALVFYNHAVAETYIARRTDASSIFVAQNALDQEPIQAARQSWLGRPEDLQAFRRQHGLTEGPVFLFSSRLDPANHVDLLLRASSTLHLQHPGLRVVIIGAGEPEMSRLRQLAGDLTMQDRVIFTGAIYDEHRLAPWFLSATAFCYPSNAGLSLLHAMGYALPIVAGDHRSKHGPEIEAVVSDHNGLLFPDGDVDALRTILSALASQPDLRARLAEGSLHTVDHDFTMDRMVAGMVEAIRYCAARIPRARALG